MAASPTPPSSSSLPRATPARKSRAEFIWRRSCAAALALLLVAQAPHPTHTARPQSVAIDLRTRDGVPMLHAFTLGEEAVIDPNKLAFTARPYDDPNASPLPLNVTIGKPIFVPPQSGVSRRGKPMYEYAMNAIFHGPPGPPGMYQVTLHAAPGFALTASGNALPFGDWSHPPAPWHENVWWPDTRDDDASLHRAQQQYAGHDVYGYGGILVGCPNSFDIYPAATPVRVTDVVRDVNQVEELWTGTTAGGGDDGSPHFFAVEPLRLLLQKPTAKPYATGGSSGFSFERCPALVRADWQLEVTISTNPPPRIPETDLPFPPLRQGLSRDDVAWRIGFPRSFNGLAAFRSADVWTYDGSPYNTFSVTFRNGTVDSFTKPGGP
jgi:hypothetical protein